MANKVSDLDAAGDSFAAPPHCDRRISTFVPVVDVRHARPKLGNAV